MKIFVVLVVTLAAVTCWAESPVLDWLDGDKRLPSGCGCSVMDAKGHLLIASELGSLIDEKGVEHWPPVFIKIAGQRHELKWVSSTHPSTIQKQGVRVTINGRRGDRFSRVYEGKDIRLTLNYKTTFVCSPKDESCEVTRYAVDATLMIKGQTHRLTGLKGECGC
jgi:hypothetical protein